MNKILRLTTSLLILGVMLMGLHTPAMASQPQAVEITFNLDVNGVLSGAGTFLMTGAFEDAGTATQYGSLNGVGTIDADMILEGQYGTIRLRSISVPGKNLDASGQFVIVSGTGAYKNIQGQGRAYNAYVVENEVPKFVGAYSGFVHFEP